MTYFLRIMLVTAGIAGSATIAAAMGSINALAPNALGDNAMAPNSLGGNALSGNALAPNAIGSNALIDNAITTNGASRAGGEPVQGLFVIGVELPSR